MPKFIAGFLLGVILTLVGVYSIIGNPLGFRESSDDQTSAADAISKVQRGSPAKTDSETVAVTGGNANVSTSTKEHVDDEHSSRAAEPDAEDDLLKSQAQNLVAQQPVAQPTSNTRGSPTRTVNDGYPPEIAEMIEKSVNKDLQARYENDQREGSWAPYMEGLLAAYFGQKPALAQFYFSLIDCRTSVCEIQALGYGPDALTRWNTATADLVSQPWFEFNNMSLNRRNPEPDVLAIVLILTKKPPN